VSPVATVAPRPPHRPPVIPAETIAQARYLAGLGWSYVGIGRELGMSAQYVGRLVRRVARTEVT